jgi:putative aldouronate transport system permease protein
MTYIRSFSVAIDLNAGLSTEQLIRVSQMSNRGLNAAKVFVALIPMLIVYPFIQKYFVKGIMIGAIKG